MHRLLTLVFLASLLSMQPANAADIAAATHITAVTVYSDRATVTREAEIEIPAGPSTAIVDSLPASLSMSSLRAEGIAISRVTLGALDSKIINDRDLAAPRERDLNAKLQDLRDKRALVEADGGANDARKTFLSTLGEQAAMVTQQNFAHIDLKPEQWSAAAVAIYNGMDETLKAAAAQSVALRQIDQQIAAMQGDLAQIQTGARSTMRLAIPLEAKEATKLTLKISYQLPAATWKPLYDARLDTATGKLTLTQFGEVRQSTGEDWTDVALTLSTGQPGTGATPPPITTEWVDLFKPQPIIPAGSADRFAAAMNMKYQQALDADNKHKIAEAQANGTATIADPLVPFNANPVVAPAPAPAMPVRATFQSAQIDTGGFVSEYRIPGPATVMADNSARKVMIGTLDAETSLVEQIRPALNIKAFLVARTKLSGDSPLLPGTANLFRDGIYIGNASLPLVRPGEETPLGFGIDDQIVVKRQVLADSQGSGGLIDKDKTQERKVVSQIHNLHRNAVKIEVLEALPVPRNDDIKLEILSGDTTPDYAKDAENTTGLALWKLNLPSDGKSDIKLGWRLSWPADSQIIGLH